MILDGIRSLFNAGLSHPVRMQIQIVDKSLLMTLGLVNLAPTKVAHTICPVLMTQQLPGLKTELAAIPFLQTE